MITFANNLDPDQAQQFVRPDQDPNNLILLMIFLQEIFINIDFEKKNQ